MVFLDLEIKRNKEKERHWKYYISFTTVNIYNYLIRISCLRIYFASIIVYLTCHFLNSSAYFFLSGEIIYILLNNYKSYLFRYLLTNYAVLQKIALQHELKSLQPLDTSTIQFLTRRLF